MKKRIRLRQVRVGMFVEELEGLPGGTGQHFVSALLRTPNDVVRVQRSKALSVVINTGKGLDADNVTRLQPSLDRSRFEQALLKTYSQEELKEARETVESAAPHIRNLLAEARINGLLSIESANAAVEQIMASATSNSGALLGILRLKNADETTFLHSIAVSALMITFGRQLGLREERVQLLGFGGLVHDLGKMTLPKEVLNKNGKLDDDELKIIREHPQRGYDLLRRIPDIHPSVLDICLYHHERYDGRGYPSGLSGEDIPYVARLAAVCDVYEAMTTIRPYKRAWSPTETIEMMQKADGHFDPGLLGSFIAYMVASGAIV